MDASLIEVQRQAILDTVRHAGGREWKVLVVDEGSKRLIDNAVKEDDILNENVTNIEQIEHRRPMNKETDALYILSALPHIVDCVMADLERRRYRQYFLVWTSNLEPTMRSRINGFSAARELIANMHVMNINFFPRESRLAIFRDPWSFLTLFHPACNNLVRSHLVELAQKIVSVCVSLNEYPLIRYFRPKDAPHEASVLCAHLARFVQDELDEYAKHRRDYPAPTPRPRGVLFITDRSMDLAAPLVHEFTYQAMAHDLLPIKEGDKLTYRTVLNQGQETEETRDMEITEGDKIWVNSRHLHMKDLLGKLAEDFKKFRAQNPQFADSDLPASVNTVKDMLAGLSDFQEGKNAYTLHLNMAQETMRLFQERNLADIAAVEQCLATGVDEDFKKPKNIAEQLVRLLDDDAVGPSERLRLILLYLCYRGGLLAGDIKKLLAHSQLPPQDGEAIYNLGLLGARVEKPLKDPKPPHQPLFSQKLPQQPQEEDVSISRFETNVKLMLQEQIKGTLDNTIFPYTRPYLEDESTPHDQVAQSSLRSAKPTWARTRPVAGDPRQRIIVFIAGGATYSEARGCYEISQQTNKDVFLASSHMLTPGLYLRQIRDLSVDKRRLDLPSDRPKPQAPAHLFERDPSPKPKPPAPPIAGMASMSLSNGPEAIKRKPTNETSSATPSETRPPSSGKPAKKEKEKSKEKKKRGFFK
ncbi:Sec1 family superfamily [Trichophyton interdigitale]|uniref:Sec1 family superfamily n=1 Tax=Trichophyton interdigitale TaxID=101480 RepID=A0A9P5CYP1_9EURO|nr:Sec1 family superfamily [Trichophyton interdigitale]KAF3898784.1 Sec1 family superfamily [Trichophyton interdigitale]KAG8210634.1 Sec1 family superfamily [Trichophyton interdigitale]